ncbi:sensor histidine kinase [Lysobacter sp. GCM10012299]|uniref:sensor histidine kinase n=1 Tax=Lysobacter sp. GCM10012299 TaxID=3317333 RepID=UPI00360CDD5E
MSQTTPAWMGKWAHDLREPLSPIQSALYLLRHGGGEGAERDDLFDLIDRQIRRLVSMIDEVNDWVRADQGRLLHIRGPVDLMLIIEGTLSVAGSGGIQVEYAPGAEQARVQGDAPRLASLFSTVFWLMSSPDVDGGSGNARATVSVDRDAGVVRLEGALGPASTVHGPVETLFAQPHPASLGDGMGLRALIALAIARGHGGDLVILDQGPSDPRIQLTLPLHDEGSA